MPYSLAIFDLDGTLVDSFPWFLRTINDVADRFGFRRVRDEDVEGLRHASTREILRRLEVPVWKLPAIARHARRLKGEAAAEISLFAGAEAMLRTLTENGVQLGLVTSDSVGASGGRRKPRWRLVQDLQHHLHRHQHGIVAADQAPLGDAAGVVDQGDVERGLQRAGRIRRDRPG